MLGPSDETVGVNFRQDLLAQARDKTLLLITQVAHRLRPGMREVDAQRILDELHKPLGASGNWHPPQIRFGENTILPFGRKGVNDPVLQENDIFFLDIGPIFDGHEGDVGRAFVLGADPEHHRCVRDVEDIWQIVSTHWREKHLTGIALYDVAKTEAEKRGWILSLEKADGHRVADFPHAARKRGSVKNWENYPAPDRWILEIQIRHPQKNFGAFYEDLLT